jgi:hypothetical protein
MTINTIHPFDLQARAAAAIHGLTALLDPDLDGLMYFLGDWRSRPPTADHCLWDCGDGSGRHVDALTLARAMLPAGWPAAARGDAEAQLEAWMWRFLAEDGLSWLPQEPWAAAWSKELLLGEGDPGRIAEVSWAQRGTLLGLVTRYRATGEERYRAAAHALVDGMLRITLRHADGLYLPEGYYRQGGWHRQEPGSAIGLDEVNAAVIVSSLRLFEATAYQPALTLAEGLARYALKHTPGYGYETGLRGIDIELLRHFHTRSNFILGVLKLGLDLGRREYVAWARQAYDAAKEWGTPFGFFPEGLGQRHGEVCCITDMIEISLLLGRYVDRAYYADAERYGRNHLLESQWLSGEQIAAAADRLPRYRDARAAGPPAGAYSTADDVAARQAGGWASRPGLNDGLNDDAPSLMQCCNAAGTRALYDLWRHAVEEQGEGESRRASVHLRFSAETPNLRVVSYEPDEGRLTITAREACAVEVRLPAGEQRAFLSSDERIGAVQALEASNGYVRFTLDAGATSHVYYPLAEWSAMYEVGRGEHREAVWGRWRGETLMRVEPPGRFYPLYERARVFGPVEPALPAGPLIESV